MSKKREQVNVFELEKYLNQAVYVKFTGGREVRGILKGHDAVTNLVLDDAKEFLRDPNDPTKVLDKTRNLGLLVCRGPSVVLVHPAENVHEVDPEELQKMAE